MAPLLMALDTPDKVAEVATDPLRFLHKMEKEVAPAANKVAIAKMRPRMEPTLQRKGLAWEDLLPLIQSLDTAELIQEASANPEGYVERQLADSGGPIAKKVAAVTRRYTPLHTVTYRHLSLPTVTSGRNLQDAPQDGAHSAPEEGGVGGGAGAAAEA